ncbi:MAG TPA: SpoIIE family protein phosphatase [Pyrinomonadaceae bacterium]|nr:SpoIIE family protein phosphatase [Pyrinomonadaceae bacterium]
MVTAIEPVLRQQLLDRRQRLESAASELHQVSELSRLLKEVDAALRRMDLGTYGLCEVCEDPIETDRLIADPLTRLCLGDLTPPEQRALEDDLELAARIQTGLLPEPSQKIDGWEIAYHYEPAGLVSGDYCDLIRNEDQNLHFVLGDVSGKGVAASMLMAHLQAMFRTLVSIRLPLEQMLERASRVFCESTLPTHYATLICGKASRNGQVEICNAGHLPALLIGKAGVRRIDATSLPVGVFSTERFSAQSLEMQPGETLFVYTDGLSETRDNKGNEFGIERLSALLAENHSLSSTQLISTCVKEVNAFRGDHAPADDVTLMAIQRT